MSGSQSSHLWGSEPSPTREGLEHFTLAEGDLYRDLVEDAVGVAPRLEQGQAQVDWAWVLDRYAGLSPPVSPA